MEFSANKPIYRQIADTCLERIITGAWKPGERVPSVREVAVELAVNTHTVLKAYEFLQLYALITPRRGLGFYLSDDAPQRVQQLRRNEFFRTALPALAAEMKLLGISPSDLLAHLSALSALLLVII